MSFFFISVRSVNHSTNQWNFSFLFPFVSLGFILSLGIFWFVTVRICMIVFCLVVLFKLFVFLYHALSGFFQNTCFLCGLQIYAELLFCPFSFPFCPALSVMYICALGIMDVFEGQPAFLSLPLEVRPAISFSRLKPAHLKYLITEIITFNLPIVQPLPFQKHNE